MARYYPNLLLLLMEMILIGCGGASHINGKKAVLQPDLRKEILQEVEKKDIARTMEFLSSDALAGRPTGSENIERAAAYIIAELERAGIRPYFDTYRHSFEVKGLTGHNVVGYLEGTDPELKDEVILIGAHYDHIGTGEEVGGDGIANGANDNASGTTAVLEIAKFLSTRDLRRSVILALFSAEEMGLVGSTELAKDLARSFGENGQELYLMFNIEMIGAPMRDKDYQVYLTGYDRSNLAEKFNSYSEEQVVGFLPQAEEYNLFRRSDNYPFFEEFQVPAHTVSSFDFTNYSYYHQVDDEFENIDVTHMERVIEALLPGVIAMANSENPEIVLR